MVSHCKDHSRLIGPGGLGSHYGFQYQLSGRNGKRIPSQQQPFCRGQRLHNSDDKHCPNRNMPIRQCDIHFHTSDCEQWSHSWRHCLRCSSQHHRKQPSNDVFHRYSDVIDWRNSNSQKCHDSHELNNHRCPGN